MFWARRASVVSMTIGTIEVSRRRGMLLRKRSDDNFDERLLTVIHN